jgi:hypothetical protein
MRRSNNIIIFGAAVVIIPVGLFLLGIKRRRKVVRFKLEKKSKSYESATIKTLGSSRSNGQMVLQAGSLTAWECDCIINKLWADKFYLKPKRWIKLVPSFRS